METSPFFISLFSYFIKRDAGLTKETQTSP